MSAYLVHPDTVNVILAAAYRCDSYGLYFHAPVVRAGALEPMIARGETISHRTYGAEIGAVLWAENVHSINCRYREDGDQAAGYRYEHVDLDWAAAGVDPMLLALKSLFCLRYQSCEAPDYEQSAGAAILRSIESAITHSLVRDHVPWGWTKAWTEERRAELKAKAAERDASPAPVWLGPRRVQ